MCGVNLTPAKNIGIGITSSVEIFTVLFHLPRGFARNREEPDLKTVNMTASADICQRPVSSMTDVMPAGQDNSPVVTDFL